jgi:hypothetical protein
MAYLGRKGASAALTSADIPDNSITAAKIVDATILAGDLAPDSVDSSELVDGSIDTSHIGANQVTAAKVAADVATQAELDAQRTNSSITTLGTVTAGNLSNSAIVYPAGHVLQIAESQIVTTSITTTATSTAAGDTNVLSAEITTRQLNSKLLCHGVMLSHLNPYNDNKGVHGELWRVYDAGTDTSIRNISVSYIHEYSAIHYHESYRTSWMYMYSPNVVAGTAVKLGIKIRANTNNASGVAGYWHYSHSDTDAFFTITEVAV